MSNYKHDYDRPPEFQWHAFDPKLSGNPSGISREELRANPGTPDHFTWGTFFDKMEPELRAILEGREVKMFKGLLRDV